MFVENYSEGKKLPMGSLSRAVRRKVYLWSFRSLKRR